MTWSWRAIGNYSQLVSNWHAPLVLSFHPPFGRVVFGYLNRAVRAQEQVPCLSVGATAAGQKGSDLSDASEIVIRRCQHCRGPQKLSRIVHRVSVNAGDAANFIYRANGRATRGISDWENVSKPANGRTSSCPYEQWTRSITPGYPALHLESLANQTSTTSGFVAEAVTSSAIAAVFGRLRVPRWMDGSWH